MVFRDVVVILLLALVGTATADLGTTDTVGGTIYDWQFNGPVYRYVASAGPYGFYVVWMFSNDTIGSQADRNMRCNYYDYATHDWYWIDPDYMMSGCDVFVERAGFGSLDADPVTYGGVVSCHAGSIRPIVGRDIAPGAGIFEFCDGSPTLDGYLWPPVAVGQNRTIHLALVDDVSRSGVWYARMVTWCDWQLGPQHGEPTFPTHNITASKVSDKVCITWVAADVLPYAGYYRISTDGGTTWGQVTPLPYPPAFGGGPDTTCSYYVTSLFPFYDRGDQLHIVVDVLPVFHDTVWFAPSEIWHWCPENSPQWSRIHRGYMNPRGTQRPGLNATFADRPSIGEDSLGNLFVSWEQFDTANVESRTNLMRADVWVSGSADNGASWVPGQRITGPDSASHRFPCIIDWAIPGHGDCDTVVVVYLADLCAGFRAGSSPTGPWTDNPFVVHKIPVDSILREVGVGANPRAGLREGISARPNPLGRTAAIGYTVSQAGNVCLSVHDVSGRLVATLASGHLAAGRYSAAWDASALSPGVYFATLVTKKTTATAKLVVQR
jgi:hypothetical protein